LDLGQRWHLVLFGEGGRPGSRQPARESANILFLNGHIYTSNPKQPWAEAVAIRGGRIQDVGTNVALKRYRGAKTHVIDLAGRITGIKVNAARNLNNMEAILISSNDSRSRGWRGP